MTVLILLDSFHVPKHIRRQTRSEKFIGLIDSSRGAQGNGLVWGAGCGDRSEELNLQPSVGQRSRWQLVHSYQSFQFHSSQAATVATEQTPPVEPWSLPRTVGFHSSSIVMLVCDRSPREQCH
jgi:hypothetical protein